MKRISFISVALLMTLSSIAYAQEVAQNVFTDPAQRFLEGERERLLEEKLLRPPGHITAPTLEEPSPQKDEMCFDVNEITVHGVTLFTDEEIRAVTDPFLGCVGYAKIHGIILALSNFYIEKGYVTSRAAIVPKQSLDDGSIEFKVQEGNIERIGFEDAKWREKLRIETAFPSLVGKHLNLRDLEQGLDQMNRLPSSNASMKLWPGEEVGGTNVVITDTAQDTVRGSVTYDNYGQSTTGIDRFRLSLESDNLFALNDKISLHYIGSQDTNAVAFSGSIPYGYWTFSYDGSYSEYLSLVDSNAAIFGTTVNNSVTLDRVIFRGASAQTSLALTLNAKESGRLLNDVLLAPQPLTVLRFGFNHTHRLQNAVWYVDGRYAKGLRWFGAMADPVNPSKDTPRAQFDKFDGGITYIRPLSIGRIHSSIRGQYSFHSLYGSEQIVMGDQSTVRGFSGAVASGDSGLYNRNEFVLATPTKEWVPSFVTKHVQPYLFADVGYTKLKAISRYDSLAGIGSGLRISWKQISGDIAVALPVYANDEIHDEGLEVYVNITLKAF